MRHFAYSLLLSGAPALLFFALAAWPGAGARAAPRATASGTLVVNSVLDEPDADPSNGSCFSTPSGKCTLRAAIMEANFHTDVNTITVPAGVYLLTRPGYDDTALVGDLDIAGQLVIQGAGAGVTIIDGNGAVIADRVFDILDGAPLVELSGLTIRHGRVPTTGGAGLSAGGGILLLNHLGGFQRILHLTDVILESNAANAGGGLYAEFAEVDLQNTTVRANTAIENGSGGGLYTHESQLTVHDSQVYSNTAAQGGGLALEGNQHTLIERSQVYSNTAAGGDGGAIYAVAPADDPANHPLTLADSNLHDNQAAFAGGAISASTAVVLSDTVVNANHAQTQGGGLFASPHLDAAVLVQASTLSRNTAQFGGGLAYEGGGSLTIVNSTLSRNSVSHDGGGLYARLGAQVRLFNTTIAANVLARVLHAANPLRGGGVFITDTAVITATNTLLADNYYTNNLTQVIPDDCFATVTALQSLGYNLLETTSNCLISGSTLGNITGQDPQLGPLQLNFGATPTQALLLGSPAIEAGQQPFCVNASGAPLTTDQRGWARPGGARCDIGAFEYYLIYSLWLPVMRR